MHAPRRRFMQQSFAGAFFLGCGSPGQSLQRSTTPLASPGLAATAHAPPPQPSRECVFTEPNIEGPFFKPDAPFRAPRDTEHHASLVDAHAEGIPLEVSGRVLGRDCNPLVGALIEIWHADHQGAYDHEGFAFRGRFRSGADGRYHLRTIIPGHYRVGGGFRPAHIHVKVHASGRPSLTTQLYFPGDPYNELDPFIRPSLVMDVLREENGAQSRFDFTV
jgi:protocatechuate 3,4-dioxygenase beta subunit